MPTQTATPITRTDLERSRDASRAQLPPYQVVLLDDDDHTYEYVIDMLRRLFGHTVEHAFSLAQQVDLTGRVVVFTTSKEHAELKRDQIGAFGRDWRIERCQGSMTATIEPACG